MVHFFEKGFSKLTIDVATSFVVMLFLDELRIRIKNFGSHRLYLNAIIGLGSGASILLLVMLTTSQIVACVVISTPYAAQKTWNGRAIVGAWNHAATRNVAVPWIFRHGVDSQGSSH